MGVAALAEEVLAALPVEHPGYPPIADHAGQSHLALGFINPAVDLCQGILARYQRLAAAEPGRADYQVDLVTSLVKTGGATEPPNRDLWRQALLILTTLQEEGRLSPAEQWKIHDLRRRLGEG